MLDDAADAAASEASSSEPDDLPPLPRTLNRAGFRGALLNVSYLETFFTTVFPASFLLSTEAASRHDQQLKHAIDRDASEEDFVHADNIEYLSSANGGGNAPQGRKIGRFFRQGGAGGNRKAGVPGHISTSGSASASSGASPATALAMESFDIVSLDSFDSAHGEMPLALPPREASEKIATTTSGLLADVDRALAEDTDDLLMLDEGVVDVKLGAAERLAAADKAAAAAQAADDDELERFLQSL